MQSKLHHDLLVDAINDYLERGYRLLMLNRSLTEDYRPDVVVENGEEMVIIEAVVTSDRVQKVEDLQTLFLKPLRIDKRIIRVGRIFIEVPDELEKRFRMKVLELYGAKKGSLGEAVREALEMWLEAKKA